MEVSGELHAPATLPPGKERPDTHWIGGWVGPQSRSVRCAEEKNPAPAENRTPVDQSVARRYTD
jgi:hypothetical protein